MTASGRVPWSTPENPESGHYREIALPADFAPPILFKQMKSTAKSIYLFLSSEKDFTAFRCILTKTRKRIDTIDSIGVTVFSMVSPNVA